MKQILPLACALLLVAFQPASAAAPLPTKAVLAANYSATVSEIHLANGADEFVGGYYREFTLKISRTGKVRGKAIFFQNDGTGATRVKITGKVTKFRGGDGEIVAEIVAKGSDGSLLIGAGGMKPPSRKKSFLLTLVKGDHHSFVLILSRN